VKRSSVTMEIVLPMTGSVMVMLIVVAVRMSLTVPARMGKSAFQDAAALKNGGCAIPSMIALTARMKPTVPSVPTNPPLPNNPDLSRNTPWPRRRNLPQGRNKSRPGKPSSHPKWPRESTSPKFKNNLRTGNEKYFRDF